MNLIEEFQKRASAAGLSKEQITSFMADAGLAEKSAADKPEDLFSAVVTAAGVEKTAAALGYAEGFLRQASDRGLSPEQAVSLAKVALASVFPKVAASEKTAAATQTPEEKAYVAGLYEKAAAYGLNEEQTTAFLRKSANIGQKIMGGIKSFAKSPGGAAGLGAGGALAAQKAPDVIGAADSALASHYNPMNGIMEWIKSNPQIAGALGGGAAGAGLGAMSGIPGEPGEDGQPDDNNVLRNALLGALAGGGVGAGGGHLAANPDMFKQLPA